MSVSCLFAGMALIVAVETGVAAPPTPATPPAPEATAPKSEILGLWKGTSTCTKVEGNEFCRDETIVYNFVDIPTQPATVLLRAAKILDGVLTRSFDLYFTFRPEQRAWTCEFDRDTGRAAWSFTIEGDALTGTGLLLPNRTVVRNVSAKRTVRDKVLAR